MIKTALIFVPHPDDEINLAGGLFGTLRAQGVRTTVVVGTNGDYYPEDAEARFYEMRKAQRILGYEALIFLGYGDGYKDRHIYDAIDEPVESRAGRRETYCAGDVPEYCFAKTGKHHAYTRANYRQDILDVLREKRADLVLCNDLDKHPDHQCLSRLFDEALDELLRADGSYRPIVLKGFAYEGALFGPPDFFDREIKPTLFGNVSPYVWEERIRLKTDAASQSLCLRRNPVFQALRAHKTQSDYARTGFCALDHFASVANPDACFWYRGAAAEFPWAEVPFERYEDCTVKRNALAVALAGFCFKLRVKATVLRSRMKKLWKK